VEFTGTSATFEIIDDGLIRATVPQGAATGPVTVVTPDGSAESPVDFIATPIDHVVVIYQENHSFDNVLGSLCNQIAQGQVQHDPCDGATSGVLPDGSIIPLAQASDIVPTVAHSSGSQRRAINDGGMNGFGLILDCRSTDVPSYRCYSQFDPTQIPNLAALATAYTISDRTFEFRNSASWLGHMALATPTTDGFKGDNPRVSKYTDLRGGGWGCDSYRDAQWWNGTKYIWVPSCVPDAQGAGPYRASPVPYVPTIFDTLDAAGLPWTIFGGLGQNPTGFYNWTICPTFFECLGSAQYSNLVSADQVLTVASEGDLPAYSVVTPIGRNSQHNRKSMALGDDWVGQVVQAIQNGPDWASTAIFIAYDDCGCFYDHVPPAQPGWGVRVPMVIVSPWAKQAYTDHNDATFISLMAFVEHTFGVQPLAAEDASAYAYQDSFDFTAPPAMAPTKLVHERIRASERRWIHQHPGNPNDPT